MCPLLCNYNMKYDNKKYKKDSGEIYVQICSYSPPQQKQSVSYKTLVFSIPTMLSTGLSRWRKCQALLRLKLHERNVLQEQDMEQLSSDEVSSQVVLR